MCIRSTSRTRLLNEDEVEADQNSLQTYPNEVYVDDSEEEGKKDRLDKLLGATAKRRRDGDKGGRELRRI